MKRRVIVTGGVAVAVAALIWLGYLWASWRARNDNGVLYLGDGSWGQLRTPQSPEKLSILAASSRDYHLSLHRLQGEERFHLALDEQGRVMDVCHSGQRKTGAVLVRFECDEMKAQKAQAEAALAQAQADLDRMERGNRPEEIEQAEATAKAQ